MLPSPGTRLLVVAEMDTPSQTPFAPPTRQLNHDTLAPAPCLSGSGERKVRTTVLNRQADTEAICMVAFILRLISQNAMFLLLAFAISSPPASAECSTRLSPHLSACELDAFHPPRFHHNHQCSQTAFSSLRQTMFKKKKVTTNVAQQPESAHGKRAPPKLGIPRSGKLSCATGNPEPDLAELCCVCWARAALLP